jgi:tRNA G26 N,N-dimethylase Trm1
MRFTLFEGRYPDLGDEEVLNAMRAMDEGYLDQDYYRRSRAKISLESSRRETFDYGNYSWTEHICRKWGQWHPRIDDIQKQLVNRGFDVVGGSVKSRAGRRARNTR